jgi:hypothetical protein
MLSHTHVNFHQAIRFRLVQREHEEQSYAQRSAEIWISGDMG